MQKLVLLGFDTMDPALVRAWADEGRLPAFRSLLETGACADYRDPPEFVSGVYWPVLHTGIHLPRRGFWYPTQMRPGSYRLDLIAPEDVPAAPFWKQIARAGGEVAVFDAPMAVPDPEIGGRQILGWGRHDWPWKQGSEPGRLLRDVEARFGRHPVPDCQDYTLEAGSLAALTRGLLEGTARRTAILRSWIDSRDWDLVYAVYPEPHCGGHVLLHLEDARDPDYKACQQAGLEHGLRQIYMAADRALGEVLDAVRGRATVAVFLPNGLGLNHQLDDLFPAFLERFNQAWMQKDAAREPARVRKDWFSALWRQTATRVPRPLYRRLRRMVPPSVRYRVSMRPKQDARAWAGQPAFPMPQIGVSCLRVNLAGREPKGQIRSAPEYRLYLDALTAELMELRDAETLLPVLDRVFRADCFNEPHSIGAGPDLVISWKESEGGHALRSETLGTVAGSARRWRTAEHVPTGLLLLDHPAARTGRQAIPGMSCLDIAPTALELLGLTPGPELEGTSRCNELLQAFIGSAADGPRG